MKKKIFMGLFLAVLLTMFSGCDGMQQSQAYLEWLNGDNEDEYADVGDIRLLRYTWDGYCVSAKTVRACETVYNIINALRDMKETGEIAPMISNDVLIIGQGDYDIERGTVWIESEGEIYRLTPDLSQICIVDSYFGEGKVLEMTDEFKEDVSNALYYAPNNYFLGTYERGDTSVKLKNVYKSDTTIWMNIKSIHVENKYDPENSIKVEVVSNVDQELTIELNCRMSVDNMQGGDSEWLRLKRGIPVTVELTFGGWKDSTYWVYIWADSTVAEITINP